MSMTIENKDFIKNIWQQYNAVYIHIPFCVQKCLYCDFASYAGFSATNMKEYTKAICHEIAIRSKEAFTTLPNATIYFGGGTPSVLPVQCLDEIVQTLKKYHFWQQPAEATIEVNPGTADLAKLEYLRQLGFDRISFGVQSLQDLELKTIGRIHNAQDALEAIILAKQAGFSKISCDLIYGLPKQTLISLRDTLNKLVATEIEHISVYGLILEENTPLAKLVESGSIILPDEDTSADMYEFVQDFLAEYGFERYEISNYARYKQYSKHNTVYWQYRPYIAFGAAACGFDGQKRCTAISSVKDYQKILHYTGDNWQTSGIYEIENLSSKQQLEEFMFMGLRRTDGADLQEAYQRYHVDVMQTFGKKLTFYLQNGYLIYDKQCQRLRLTSKGMEIGNRIFEIFVIE